MTEPEVGTAGEEAWRLLRALGASSVASSDGDADHSCSNGWCPVCQVANFVRDNPEAIATVAASAGSMLVALRDLIDAAITPKDPS